MIPLAGGWLGDTDYDAWKLDNGEDAAKIEAQERADEEEDARLNFESQWGSLKPTREDGPEADFFAALDSLN